MDTVEYMTSTYKDNLVFKIWQLQKIGLVVMSEVLAEEPEDPLGDAELAEGDERGPSEVA